MHKKRKKTSQTTQTTTETVESRMKREVQKILRQIGGLPEIELADGCVMKPRLITP